MLGDCFGTEKPKMRTLTVKEVIDINMKSSKIHLIFIAVSYLFLVVNAKTLIWRISDDLKVGKNLHKESSTSCLRN